MINEVPEKRRRLRKLDFLRGIAIVLVLLRHQVLFEFTHKMGWMGVDLFFVLSGFLVSNLLFLEYQKFGDIRPGLFLIRRGFKIYPVYYIFFALYLLPLWHSHHLELKGILSDMFFVQNYTRAWGYAFFPSWSLAVEEHFYFGLVLLFFLGINKNILLFTDDNHGKISRLEIFITAVMLLCLVLRIISNPLVQTHSKLITMTHLRIDSLLAGVMVAYWFHFRNDWLSKWVNGNKMKLAAAILLLLSFTPFIDFEESYFVITAGFSCVFIAFSLLLMLFLMDNQMDKKLVTVFTGPVVNAVSKIGFASYAIYIVHVAANTFMRYVFAYALKIHPSHALSFFSSATISVFAGIAITKYLEKYFLSVRDRYFPSRV